MGRGQVHGSRRMVGEASRRDEKKTQKKKLRKVKERGISRTRSFREGKKLSLRMAALV